MPGSCAKLPALNPGGVADAGVVVAAGSGVEAEAGGVADGGVGAVGDPDPDTGGVVGLVSTFSLNVGTFIDLYTVSNTCGATPA